MILCGTERIVIPVAVDYFRGSTWHSSGESE